MIAVTTPHWAVYHSHGRHGGLFTDYYPIIGVDDERAYVLDGNGSVVPCNARNPDSDISTFAYVTQFPQPADEAPVLG